MSEPLAVALIAHLVRTGALDADDIATIARALDDDGDADAAHEARCSYAEAIAPTASEFNADRARRRFRIVPSDGGNEPT